MRLSSFCIDVGCVVMPPLLINNCTVGTGGPFLQTIKAVSGGDIRPHNEQVRIVPETMVIINWSENDPIYIPCSMS